MKWQDPHTKKLKYCSSEIFDEHNNKFGKVWSPVYEFMTGTNTFTLPILKIDLSYHHFIKYDIFKVTVNFPLGGTHIGIVLQYC